MTSTAKPNPALLRRGSLMRIDAAAGDRVTCVRGMVWLTQENDPLDRILGAGESFLAERRGTVLVNALAHDATLEHSAHPARCSIMLTAPYRGKSATTLAAEIGRLQSRIRPQELRAMTAGPRREAVEREARRMRGQVFWLVLQHAKRALVATVTGATTRLAQAFKRAWRASSRARRANAS
jgi:hypothetical protein